MNVDAAAAPSSTLLCKQKAGDDLALGPSPAPSTSDVRLAHSSPYPSPLLTWTATGSTPASGTARTRALNAAIVTKDAQSTRGQLKKQSHMRARRSSSEGANTTFRAVLRLETPTYLVSDIEDWETSRNARSAVA